jgi:hypothetical protein
VDEVWPTYEQYRASCELKKQLTRDWAHKIAKKGEEEKQ